MANMSIEELIEEIEVYVDNCKTAGVLSSGSMIKINREELLAMLDEVRTRLPKELAESRQIIKIQGIQHCGCKGPCRAYRKRCSQRGWCDD